MTPVRPPDPTLSDEDHAARIREDLQALKTSIANAKKAGLEVKVDADSYLLGMVLHLDRAVRVVRVY